MEQLYIVTGAMGHLGSTLVEKLLAAGKQVRGLALPGDRSNLQKQPDFELVRGDVTDMNSLNQLFANISGKEVTVIHTAGLISIAGHKDKRLERVNVDGTRNIVRQCLIHSVKKLVHVSSVHAIPEKPHGQFISEVSHFDPDMVHGAYAKTKAEASQAVLSSTLQGLDASIVHPSGIIGPGDHGRGHLTQLIIDYLRGHLAACVKGGYDFVDVRDVADGILACADKGAKGECYILSGEFCEISEMLCKLHHITGHKELKTILPSWFAMATAPFAEAYYKILRQPPLYTAYSLYTLDANGIFTHQKATRDLGYHPRPLTETLRDTATWLAAEGRLDKNGEKNARHMARPSNA